VPRLAGQMSFGDDAFGFGQDAFGESAFGGEGVPTKKKKKDKKEKRAKFADEALDFAAPADPMGFGNQDPGFVMGGEGFNDFGATGFGEMSQNARPFQTTMTPPGAEQDWLRTSTRLVDKLASESGQRGESMPYYMARLHEIIDTSPEERAENDAEARRAIGEAHPGLYLPTTNAHGLGQAELLGLVGVHSRPPTGELPTAHGMTAADELLTLQRAYAELAYRGEAVPSWLYMRPRVMASQTEPFLKTVPANFRGFDDNRSEYYAGASLQTPSSPILDRWPLSEQLFESIQSLARGQPVKESPNNRYVWQRVVELAEAYVRRTPEPLVGAGAKKSDHLSVPHFTRPDEDPRYGIAPKTSHHEQLDAWVRSKLQADDKLGAKLDRQDNALEKEWNKGARPPRQRPDIPVDGPCRTASVNASAPNQPSTPRAIPAYTGRGIDTSPRKVPVVRSERVSPSATPRSPMPSTRPLSTVAAPRGSVPDLSATSQTRTWKPEGSCTGRNVVASQSPFRKPRPSPPASTAQAPAPTQSRPRQCAEPTQARPDLFDFLDRNHDGVITRSEFASAVSPTGTARPDRDSAFAAKVDNRLVEGPRFSFTKGPEQKAQAEQSQRRNMAAPMAY